MAENSDSDSVTHSPEPSVEDARSFCGRDLNSPREFPIIRSLEEWELRRRFIREQALVSCGLAPFPDRTPLRPRVFDRVDRDDYSIEKVVIETLPGFYLCGNLYRPAATEARPDNTRLPGVLVAHGHWPTGRFTNISDGSIPARAITFARQGFIAFTYDMVGYNDTRSIPHTFGGTREHELWSISLMGLQTWNSVRAVDFLASLPDVDPKRLAMTGESGGGTQTFMCAAIDERLAAVAPCVMVSHIMQGGCLCENAPGLRVEISNMELAAAAAPRPQVLVGATGDWTATTETVEGPAVASVYRLYGAEDRLEFQTFPFNHNINRTSREAVYRFFARWLLYAPDPGSFNEPDYVMEPADVLKVFPDRLPADAKSPEELTAYLKHSSEEILERRKPRDPESLQRFRADYEPVWRHTLQFEIPSPGSIRTYEAGRRERDGFVELGLRIGGTDRGDRVPVKLFEPVRPGRTAVIVADPPGIAATTETGGGDIPDLALKLTQAGFRAILLDLFGTIEASSRPPVKFETTYNRTLLQERVQDLVTGVQFARSRPGVERVVLVGLGEAGLWSILAGPVADALAADAGACDLRRDDVLLSDELFAPGLRRMGDFRTAIALGAPGRLYLWGSEERFPAAAWAREIYKSLAPGRLKIGGDTPGSEALCNWVKESNG